MLNNFPLCWWTTFYSSIYPSVYGHLGCFYFSDFKNNAAILFVYKFLWGLMFSFVLSIYLGIDLLDLIVSLCFTVWGMAKLCSTMATVLYNPASNVWEFQFLLFFANACYYGSFKIVAILVGVKWYLIVVFIAFS